MGTIATEEYTFLQDENTDRGIIVAFISAVYSQQHKVEEKTKPHI